MTPRGFVFAYQSSKKWSPLVDFNNILMAAFAPIFFG
jgi:hypothetical protein